MSLIAAAEEHLRRAQTAACGHAGGRRVLRIALNASIVYVFANSAAHAHSLLDRYDKAAQVQLLATATGLPLGEITAAVVCQPQNAFLCGTSSPAPQGAKMHLEAQKRLLRAAALAAREDHLRESQERGDTVDAGDTSAQPSPRKKVKKGP